MAVSFEKVMNGQDSHSEGAIWENESFQQWGKFEKKKKKKTSGPAFVKEFNYSYYSFKIFLRF